jgi:hypothetical protein
LGGDCVLGLFDDARRAGQGVDHQGVPTDEDLVVLAGADALVANRQQFGTGFGELHFQLVDIPVFHRGALLDGFGQVEDAFAVLEIAGVADVIGITKTLAGFLTEDLFDLGGRPNIELSLLAFAVGVFSAVEAAGGIGHVGEDVVAGLAHDTGEALFASD